MAHKQAQFFKQSNLLFLDEKVGISVVDSLGNIQVGYGVPAASFSLDRSGKLLAIVGKAHRGSTELQVFRFFDGDVGEKVGGISVSGVYHFVIWSPESDFVVVTGDKGCAVIRVTGSSLSLLCRDDGTHCCFVAGLFGELDGRSQTLALWSLEKNKKVGEVSLFRRAISVLDLCGVRNTVFTLYKDFSLTVTLVDPLGASDKLQKIEGLFKDEQLVDRAHPAHLICIHTDCKLVVGLKSSQFLHLFEELPSEVVHVSTFTLSAVSSVLAVQLCEQGGITVASESVTGQRQPSFEFAKPCLPIYDKSSLGRKKGVKISGVVDESPAMMSTSTSKETTVAPLKEPTEVANSGSKPSKKQHPDWKLLISCVCGALVSTLVLLQMRKARK
jgi:hypothetical protein